MKKTGYAEEDEDRGRRRTKKKKNAQTNGEE